MVNLRSTDLLDLPPENVFSGDEALVFDAPNPADTDKTGVLSLSVPVRLQLVDRDTALGLIDEMENTGLVSHFQKPAWLMAVMDAADRDNGEQVYYVAGYDGQRCRIVLPLVISTRRGLRRIQWLGQAESDYNAPVLDPDFCRSLNARDVRRIWREAALLAGGADVVFARKQPVTIVGNRNPFAAIGRLRESDRAHLRRLNRPWQEIEVELSSTKSRRRLREKHRAMKKLGLLELRAVTDPDEITRCAGKLMAWKCDQLERTGATNPFADLAYRRFFSSVCTRGAVSLHAVFLDGTPIAVTCMLGDARGCTLYQTAFDPHYSRHSPGRILNLELLKQASEAGAEYFDFGYGDEDYKQSMCDRSLELTLSIIPLTARGTVAAFLLRSAMMLRQRIKQSPMLRHGAFSLNRSMKSAFAKRTSRGRADSRP